MTADGPELRFDYAYRPHLRNWVGTPGNAKIMALLEGSLPKQRKLIQAFRSRSDRYTSIPIDGDPNTVTPYWMNGWFESLDALSLYCLLAERNPRTYVEVGSGNSTKFARRAIQDFNLRTKIVSVDPEPRAGIDTLCDQVVRTGIEHVDQRVFFNLGSDDLLFIDNSHRSFTASDVTVFFTEVLPGLSPHLAFGVHDIFLPYDYPERWLDRFYNEQYLLMAYLFGGADGRSVLLSNKHLAMSGEAASILQFEATPLAAMPLIGCAFWLDGRQ